MSVRPVLLSLILPAAGVLSGCGPAAADPAPGAAEPGSPLALLFPAVITNLTIALAIVLLFVLGLYAYASLARFAPYRSWIYLFLVSLTGVVWAMFLLTQSDLFAEAIFFLITILGVNLMVHVFRFDRIDMVLQVRQEQGTASLFDV